MTAEMRIEGAVAPGFEYVRDLLLAGAAGRSRFGAQLSVRVHGEEVVDLVVGDRLEHDSVTGVYSATKGVAVLTIARLIDAGLLSLSQPVAEVWPEFAAAGKASVTVGQLLSHQAGLPAISSVIPFAELVASAPAAARLAAQTPLWVPGSAFGYHALTIGILMEELVRRAEARELRDAHEELRSVRDADFYIGMPATEDSRYVDVEPVTLTAEQEREVASRPQGDPLSELVFSNVDAGEEWSTDGISTNNPRVRRAGPAAIGGVGSARGLATLYADALPGSDKPIASQETFAAMRQMRSWGTDRTLGITNAFGAVFMVAQPRMPFGSLEAFGHDGAGGALGFADPATGVSFGYIPVPMQYPGGADPLAVQIARALRDALR